MIECMKWARLAALTLPFALSGCMSAMTGGVEPVLARADRTDPVQAAVADVLATVDQNFAPVLGPAVPAAERQTLIGEWTSFRWASQGQSSMDLLRSAESMASTARSVSVSIPGSETLYYEQPVMVGNVNALSHAIEFRFDVPFEQRKQKAAELVTRVAPLFTGVKNWYRTDATDPATNPVIGGTTFVTYLSMSLDASSELVMVSVDYYHDRVNHEAMRGVRLRINKQSTRVD